MVWVQCAILTSPFRRRRIDELCVWHFISCHHIAERFLYPHTFPLLGLGPKQWILSLTLSPWAKHWAFNTVKHFFSLVNALLYLCYHFSFFWQMEKALTSKVKWRCLRHVKKKKKEKQIQRLSAVLQTSCQSIHWKTTQLSFHICKRYFPGN